MFLWHWKWKSLKVTFEWFLSIWYKIYIHTSESVVMFIFSITILLIHTCENTRTTFTNVDQLLHVLYRFNLLVNRLQIYKWEVIEKKQRIDVSSNKSRDERGVAYIDWFLHDSSVNALNLPAFFLKKKKEIIIKWFF